MRALFILLPLAACGSPAGEGEAAPSAAIECAVDGAADFQPVCTVEQAAGEGKAVLVLRHPSGGFRKLEIATDGRGVAAADGAQQAVVTPVSGNRIEVELGGDRYRLPATVKGRAAP